MSFKKSVSREMDDPRCCELSCPWNLEEGRVEVGGRPPGPVKEGGWGRGWDREDQGPG